MDKYSKKESFQNVDKKRKAFAKRKQGYFIKFQRKLKARDEAYDRIKEEAMVWAKSIFLLLCISILFFNRLWFCLFLSPCLFFWNQKERMRLRKKKEKMCKAEVRDFFQSFVNCMSAGYSMEQSIPIVKKELEFLYGRSKSFLVGELEILERKLQMNQSFESAFYEFAQSTRNEDVQQFSFVLRTAKKKGGNLIQILENTIQTMERKNQVEEEIITVLAGRVFEKNVMKAVPFFLVAYLRFFNFRYLEVMYTSLAGEVCMAVSLLILAVAGKLADRIVEISV